MTKVMKKVKSGSHVGILNGLKMEKLPQKVNKSMINDVKINRIMEQGSKQEISSKDESFERQSVMSKNSKSRKSRSNKKIKENKNKMESFQDYTFNRVKK